MGSTVKSLLPVGLGMINPALGLAYAGYKAYDAYDTYRDVKHQTGQAGMLADQQHGDQMRFLDQQAASAQRAANIQASAAMHAAHAFGHAAGQVREIAGKNAALTLAEGAETVRRAKREHKQVEGTTKALAWASGIRADQGSAKTYMKEQKGEHGKIRSWINRAFGSRANIIRAEGEMQAGMLESQAHGAAAQAAAIAEQGRAVQAEIGYSRKQADVALSDYKRNLQANLTAARKGYQGEVANLAFSAMTAYAGGFSKGGTIASGGGSVGGGAGMTPNKFFNPSVGAGGVGFQIPKSTVTTATGFGAGVASNRQAFGALTRGFGNTFRPEEVKSSWSAGRV